MAITGVGLSVESVSTESAREGIRLQIVIKMSQGQRYSLMFKLEGPIEQGSDAQISYLHPAQFVLRCMIGGKDYKVRAESCTQVSAVR